MKINQEDYIKLRTAIESLDISLVQSHYDLLKTNFMVKDLALRFRWDLLYATRVDLLEMYTYLDDSHIDTALKQIVKELRLGQL